MFQKAYFVYCRIQEIIVGFCFSGVVLLTFMNAVLRFFKKPIVTADDIVLLLFAWGALLGADVALRYSRLVGMDMLVNKLPPKTQKALQLLVYVIMIVAMLFFIRYGFQLAFGNWRRFLNTLPISYGWVTISLPVACILMVITSSIKITKVVRKFGDDSYNVRKDNPEITAENL